MKGNNSIFKREIYKDVFKYLNHTFQYNNR